MTAAVVVVTLVLGLSGIGRAVAASLSTDPPPPSRLFLGSLVVTFALAWPVVRKVRRVRARNRADTESASRANHTG